MNNKAEKYLEGPIYDDVNGFGQESFFYTSFQAFLDSQFRKDLYRALNTDDYQSFSKVKIKEKNLPLWLCNSIYEYACKRNCNRNILNELRTIRYKEFLTPEQVHISEGDIINGWKVVEVIRSEVPADKIFELFSTKDEKIKNLDEFYPLPEIKGYVFEKNVGN